MEILEKLDGYIKQHKFLFFAQVISFIIAFFTLITGLIVGENIINLLVFIFPVIIVCLISYIGWLTFPKYPKATKIVTALLNLLIIFIVQMFILSGVWVIFQMVQADKVYDNPKQYKKAIKSINNQERVSHFPVKIPEEAYNIKLSKCANSWFGSEAILVKFNINQTYINNELTKNKFISVEEPDSYKHRFDDAMLTDNGRIDIEGFTFYVINDREHENLPGHHFPYHYGIGVNDGLGEIVYYYTCPD